MADVFPLILGIIILLASVISIKTGISVTVVEIAIGVIIGNLGFFHSESWMIYIASFGGILLTFLAGVEIDVDLMKDNFKESFTIGFLSFLIPFLVSAFRNYTIGTDTSGTYMEIFNRIRNGESIRDLGFGVITKVSLFIFNNYTGFLILTSLIFCGLSYICIFRDSKYPAMSVLLFFTISLLKDIVLYKNENN